MSRDDDKSLVSEQERAKFLHDIATPLIGIQLSNKLFIKYLPILLSHYQHTPDHKQSPAIASEHLDMLAKAPAHIRQMVQEAQGLASIYGRRSHNKASPQQTEVSKAPISLDDSLSILVAEDNSMHRKLAQRLLGNYQLDMVANGQQALEAVQQNIYDLVILDLYMPILSGEEVVGAIVQQSLGQPWIIACTNKPIDDELEHLRAKGFDRFTGKPLTLAGLKAALDSPS